MAKQTFTLMIERKYGDGPSSWWPAFENETAEEGEECLADYPAVYGEVSRCIVVGGKSADPSESRLRLMSA